jgi:outer membrane protein OmpA-like peptidoglycan-associated protein
MQNNQSSYSRWSWIIALLLGLILLWMLMTGRGPSSACCTPAAEPALATEAITPAAEPIVEATATTGEAFHFVASGSDFTSTGDGSNIAWLAQADALKSIVNIGDVKAEGDDKNVVLSGLVDSEAIKQQKGADAQAFFGPEVTVDNQLTVKAAEAVAMTPPPAAKLYFNTGKTTIKGDANAELAAVVDWLKANASAKAVISGFHDSRGDPAFNEELAKNRAKSTRDTLMAAGIDEARIELRKPQSVDGGADLDEARRVEVSVE